MGAGELAIVRTWRLRVAKGLDLMPRASDLPAGPNSKLQWPGSCSQAGKSSHSGQPRPGLFGYYPERNSSGLAPGWFACEKEKHEDLDMDVEKEEVGRAIVL